MNKVTVRPPDWYPSGPLQTQGCRQSRDTVPVVALCQSDNGLITPSALCWSVCVCAYIHMCICICIDINIHMHIHIHIYIYLHIHTHIYIYISTSSSTWQAGLAAGACIWDCSAVLACSSGFQPKRCSASGSASGRQGSHMQHCQFSSGPGLDART